MTISAMYAGEKDVAREIRRLGRFGVEVPVGPLGCRSSDGDDAGHRVVAFFHPKIDEDGWEIKLSPTATEEERVDALQRAFEVISHPETHPCWQKFPEILHGAKTDWGIRLTAPTYPLRTDLGRSLAQEIQHFVQITIARREGLLAQLEG
jgi:hypothetical protein